MDARCARLGLGFGIVALGLLLAGAAPDPARAEDGPLRVATFGTSLTANGGWQKPLAAAMEACVHRPVIVSNHGRPGAGSDWGIRAVADVAAERADIVFLEFAVNDAALEKMIGISRSLDNMRAIIRAIREERSDARIYVMSMNPIQGRRHWLRPWRDRYEDAHRRLSQDLGLAYIDHRPDWEAMGSNALYLAIPDGVHPMPGAASAVIVPNIMKRLARDGVLPCGGDGSR